MKWIFLILSCISVSAQHPLFTGSGIDWTRSSSSGFVPSQISGITYWWVSSDLTLNTTVGNWADRIAGNIKSNGDAATVPTNSSGGVGFTGTTFLTNTTQFLVPGGSADGSFWVVFTPQVPTSNGGLEGTAEAGGHGMMYTTSGNLLKPFASGSTAFSSYAAGVTYDLACVKTNGTLNIVYYTNNVPITVLANGFSVGGNMKFSGKDGFGDFYKGKILEIAYFATNLSVVGVSNLHYYSTNTYHYAP